MNYDFDILPFTTDAFQNKYEGLLSRFGMTEQAAECTALFRDPAVIRALSGASQEVRDCFFESGFGVTAYDSGVGENKFPEASASRRELAIERLRRNIAKIPANASWNGFDVEAFFEAAEAALPVNKTGVPFSVMKTPKTSEEAPLAAAIRATSRALSTPAHTF